MTPITPITPIKISVCIATYNGEAYITEQLNSIIPQLNKADEIIISDNNSEDLTLEKIYALSDSRIKILSNKKQKVKSKHTCISANFENALTHATGDIIFLCDQDDIWSKNKVKESLRSLQYCDLITSDCHLIKNGTTDLNSSFYNNSTPKTGIIKKLVKIRYHGCTMAFKREILTRALPFPEGTLLHDGWIGLIAELYGKTLHINLPLTHYRIHDNNLSLIHI